MNTLHIFAQTITAADAGIPKTTPGSFLTNALYVIYFIAGVVAVISIIIAGLTYVTSGGESSGVVKAKNTILYSVVGLIVVLLAFVITQFVVGRF
jgi:hypothetical protein